jgi:hypothetical protein
MMVDPTNKPSEEDIQYNPMQASKLAVFPFVLRAGQANTNHRRKTWFLQYS